MIAFAPILLSACAASPSPHVVVVADAPGKLVDEAVAGLAKDGARVDVRIVSSQLVDGADGDTVYLAAGPKSARSLTAFNHVKRAAFLVKASDVPTNLPAVTLDAPLASQFAWLKTAFPGRARVIVPRSKSDDDAALKEAATKAGVTLQLVDVKSPGEAVPAVDEALKKSAAPAVILLVPDPVAVTPDTVAPLVQDALSLRTPVVGFSTYFLKVGAIGAISVDAASMARQALALASDSGGAAVAPESGHLVVDGRLAERLGVSVHEGAGVEVRR